MKMFDFLNIVAIILFIIVILLSAFQQNLPSFIGWSMALMWMIIAQVLDSEMVPRNIKTSYGNFSTMIHYENYWKKKVKEASSLGENN